MAAQITAITLGVKDWNQAKQLYGEGLLTQELPHAQALLDQVERGEGRNQLFAGHGQVIAALGPQAREDLAALLHHPARFALNQGERGRGPTMTTKTRLSMRWD
jgi:hypothetical protein